MSHERYERLILGAAALTPADQADLVRHLAGCRACTELHRRWSRVHAALSAPAMAPPAPGFHARWAARHAVEEALRQRRQAWRLFGLTSIGAAGLASALGLLVLQVPAFLPDVFASMLQQALRWWIWARVAGEVTRAFALSLPTPVAALAVIGCTALMGGAAVLAALGAFGILRISFQGVQQ